MKPQDQIFYEDKLTGVRANELEWKEAFNEMIVKYSTLLEHKVSWKQGLIELDSTMRPIDKK